MEAKIIGHAIGKGLRVRQIKKREVRVVDKETFAFLHLKGFEGGKIKQISVRELDGLSLAIITKDGWEIHIGQGLLEGENLFFITRWKRPYNDYRVDDMQYLTREGKWEIIPEKHINWLMPEDAARIPLA